MQSFIQGMIETVSAQLLPTLRNLESEYVKDAYASTLEQVFNNLRIGYNNVAAQAQKIASEFVSDLDQESKSRFYKSVETSIGVNLNNVVANEGIEDILRSVTRENVALIKSIPDEYFKKIETIVFNGTIRGRTASSMIKEISSLNGSTYKRSRLIARDQTSKLNSALNEQRQRNIGVEEYVWRTSEDDNVRESHKAHNGKIFRWDDPPKDTGHPGEDIQCRCIAQPILRI